jgi:hypothetical protein
VFALLNGPEACEDEEEDQQRHEVGALQFRVLGAGFRVQGSGFRVHGSGF